jgi:hypothetical protein
MKNCSVSSFGDFVQDCFGYSGSFCVSIGILGFFFWLCEECHWYFDRDCIESEDCFG